MLRALGDPNTMAQHSTLQPIFFPDLQIPTLKLSPSPDPDLCLPEFLLAETASKPQASNLHLPLRDMNSTARRHQLTQGPSTLTPCPYTPPHSSLTLHPLPPPVPPPHPPLTLHPPPSPALPLPSSPASPCSPGSSTVPSPQGPLVLYLSTSASPQGSV